MFTPHKPEITVEALGEMITADCRFLDRKLLRPATTEEQREKKEKITTWRGVYNAKFLSVEARKDLAAVVTEYHDLVMGILGDGILCPEKSEGVTKKEAAHRELFAKIPIIADHVSIRSHFRGRVHALTKIETKLKIQPQGTAAMQSHS